MTRALECASVATDTPLSLCLGYENTSIRLQARGVMTDNTPQPLVPHFRPPGTQPRPLASH
jgi:hypothetical protein